MEAVHLPTRRAHAHPVPQRPANGAVHMGALAEVAGAVAAAAHAVGYVFSDNIFSDKTTLLLHAATHSILA